jgi:lipooligosaccharide transport system permease protein
MNISYRFFRVWQRNLDVFSRLWHTEAPGFIAEPVIILLAMGIGLGAYVGLVGGQSYMAFIVPGIICSYAMYSSVFECTYGSFTRMEYEKTYDAIISTPLSIDDVITGEIFWGATRSLLTGIVILAIASAFQLVHSAWAVLIIPVVFLEGIMFSSLAMFFTSLVPSIYTFNYFFTLFVTPMFFFSGVFFPLTSFPPVVQTLSWIAPLTAPVYICRNLLDSTFGPGVLGALGIMVFFVLVFFWLALRMMRRRLLV